jgi:putative transposase
MSKVSRSVSLVSPRNEHEIANGEARIWLRRFWDHDMARAADREVRPRHCWYNPVKHSLVENAVEWPYASH